jgi:hypothetical protein
MSAQAGIHRLPQLTDPPAPGILAPEIIGPEKAALLEIQPRLRRFLVVERGAAGLGHHHERTVDSSSSVKCMSK